MTDYVYLGIRALNETEKSMREAYATPLIMVGGSPPPEPWTVIHAAALAAGLPEIPGHYGYDFERHEFIRLPDAAMAPPRAPAAVRVLEMLGHPALTIRSSLSGRYEFTKVEIEPHGAFEAAELLSALKSYRASLVKPETRRAAEEAAADAAKAQAAMNSALESLPDDMREEVRSAAFPERR